MGLEKYIEHVFINPGKPMQNGFIESFNGKLRAERLNLNWFHNLQEVREIISRWKDEYNMVLHIVRWAKKLRQKMRKHFDYCSYTKIPRGT